jgi:hypothetical protein
MFAKHSDNRQRYSLLLLLLIHEVTFPLELHPRRTQALIGLGLIVQATCFLWIDKFNQSRGLM